MKEIPKSTKVVVVGGGVAGCSTAYHLAKFGWKDTILLERDQLTSGTTWHAAGLVGQLGASATITKFRKYSLDLYKQLEKETELSTGLKQNGAITVASTTSRLEELKRQATTAQLYNVDVRILDKDQIKKGKEERKEFSSELSESSSSKKLIYRSSSLPESVDINSTAFLLMGSNGTENCMVMGCGFSGKI